MVQRKVGESSPRGECGFDKVVKLPLMRFVFYGISSFSYWLSASCRPSLKNAVGPSVLKRCTPTAKTVAYVQKVFPQIPQPYHALVPDHSKSAVPQAVTHVSIFPYREKPFARIADGIYASCPELCFVQLALALPLYELVKAGDALCGRFYIDPMSDNGLGSRPALTSKRRIEAFICRNAGLRGAAAAKSALCFVVDNAASPPEAFLWSVLSIPHRYGGFALPGLVMNRKVKPSKKARRIARRETLVPDLCHVESRLAIEYDSNAEHLTSRQIAKDASKRLALEADGYKVISVTARQLGDRNEMHNVAKEAGSRIGRRIQIRAKSFKPAQRMLYVAGWSLAAYHSREWLGRDVAKDASGGAGSSGRRSGSAGDGGSPDSRPDSADGGILYGRRQDSTGGVFDSVRCLRDMRGGVASALSTLSALRCGVCEGAESVCEEVECTGVECTGAQAASDCGGRRRGAESVCQRVRKACARGCGMREDYGGRRSTGSWEAVGARSATRAVGATEGVFCAKRGTSRSFLFHLAQEGTIRPGEMVRIFRLERLEGVLGLREVPRFAHFAFVSAQRMREGFQFAGSPDASAGMSGAPTCRCHAGCRRRAGCCRYAADVLAAAGASPICCRRDDCCRPTRFRSRGCAIGIL